MKTFGVNVNKANEMVNRVWDNYTGKKMHANTLNAWANAKRKYLAEMFGEELILKKEVTIEQSCDAMNKALSTFRWELKRMIHKEEWFIEAYEKSIDISFQIDILLSDNNLYDNKCNRKYDFGEKRKFNAGEKLTRGFKKLLTDPVEINNMQVAYSQMMNTKKLTGDLCLSIHPMDFLTMSHTRTWSSCYDVFKEGEYRAGALEFMCSDNTICAYLYTKEMRIEGQEWNDKKWRCIISVDPNKYIMTGKNYPYQSDELTNLAYEWVRELVRETEKFPAFKDTHELDDIIFTVGVEYGYNDADCGYSSSFKVGLNSDKNKQNYIHVSYGAVPCTKCGMNAHIAGESLICEHCDESFYCESCDYRTNGESYNVYNSWGERIEVCECCFYEYYQYCDSCGNYHYSDSMTEAQNGNRNCYCQSCAEKKTYNCDECGDLFDDDGNQHKGRTLCEDCYDEALSEEAEKEEVEEE